MKAFNSRALAFAYASWFGAGYCPLAPATVGTLLALPLYGLLTLLPSPLQWVVLGIMTLAAYKATEIVVGFESEHDPQLVVIDEVVAILLALIIAAPDDLWSLLVGVVLFRCLDIWKPWPIHLAERLRPAALGILADDLLAGLGAGIVVLLL
ncbi:phosphatidylglycerophosphatase A family protein [Devosia sp. CAU 1758]